MREVSRDLLLFVLIERSSAIVLGPSVEPELPDDRESSVTWESSRVGDCVTESAITSPGMVGIGNIRSSSMI